MENIKFPDDIRNFAKELAILCKKHNLENFSGNFAKTTLIEQSPPVNIKLPYWWNCSFSWDSGRHRDSVDDIEISIELRLSEKISR